MPFLDAATDQWAHLYGDDEYEQAAGEPSVPNGSFPGDVRGRQRAYAVARSHRTAAQDFGSVRPPPTPYEDDYPCLSGCQPAQGNPCGGPRCT